MTDGSQNILTINGGSSSIKFTVFHANGSLQRGLVGKIERIGVSGTCFTYHSSSKNRQGQFEVGALTYETVVDVLIDWLEAQEEFASIQGIGHRIVHGMQHTQPELVTQELLSELIRISPDLSKAEARIAVARAAGILQERQGEDKG